MLTHLLRDDVSSAPALTALRERTRDLHAGLEARLQLAMPGAGRSQYAAHVAAMWGWMQPIEARLWTRDCWPAGIEPAARNGKCAWLQQDMQAASEDGFLTAGTVRRCVRAEDFSTSAARFGWAYVIEGSMLGGAVLHRRLGARLAPWPMRYLQGYGRDAGARWRAFLDTLERELDTPAQREAAAVAAATAFASIDAWFTGCGAA